MFERRDPAHTDRVASRAHEARTGAGAARGRGGARRRARLGRHDYDERCRLLRAAADGIGDAPHGARRAGEPRDGQVAHRGDPRGAGGDRPDRGLRRPHGGERGLHAPLNSFVEGERNVDVLRPYGVFGVIAPFNFPVALSIGMASSALIAGNTVVFKPSEETPATGAALGRSCTAPGCRPARSTSCTAGRTPGARSWTRGWTASPSPARRRWAGRSRGSSRTARTRGPRSPRWAARTRRSSPRAPTWTPRPRAWRARPSACRARSAARARGRSWPTRSTTSSWRGWPRRRGSWRSAIRATRRCSSGP